MQVIVGLLLLIIIIISLWRLFEKAGQPAWAAIVPIYNLIIILKIVDLPLWTIILFFIPVVNVCFLLYLWYNFSLSYGKGVLFAIGLAALPFIFLPILAFGDSAYVGNDDWITPEVVNSAFWKAINQGGDTKYASYLLSKGADIDMRGENGETLLMRAAEQGFVNKAIYLLENGAEIDAQDNNGNTALMYAIHAKQEKMLKLLLSGSVD